MTDQEVLDEWYSRCENCLTAPKAPGRSECDPCARYRRRVGRARPHYLADRGRT
jgi:hypothetical protein